MSVVMWSIDASFVIGNYAFEKNIIELPILYKVI